MLPILKQRENTIKNMKVRTTMINPKEVILNMKIINKHVKQREFKRKSKEIC